MVLQMGTSAVWPCAVTWAIPGGRRPSHLTYPTHIRRCRVPAADQELLALAAWEGLTTGQIAAVLGCSPNAVRIRPGVRGLGPAYWRGA